MRGGVRFCAGVLTASTLRAENRDRFHSVRSVTNLRGRDHTHRPGAVRGIEEDRVAHEPLPAAAAIPPRERRREHLLPPARPPRRRQRRPGAPRPHGDRLLRAAPTRATTSTPASTASAASSTAPLRQEVALVGVGNLGHAVLSHFADKSPSVAIVAAFDVDPALTDTLIHGVRCVDVVAHGGAGPRPRHRDRRAHRAGRSRPGRRRRRSCAPASRASSASPPLPSPCPTRSSSSTWTSRRRSSRPPTSRASAAARSRPTNGDGDIEPMVKKLESLLARSNMKLEDLATNIGARIVTPGQAGRHRRSPRSTPATA